MTQEILIRPIARTDYDAWSAIWTKYLEYYRSSVPDSVYAITFERFFDTGEFEPNCLIAELDGTMVGLTHFQYHRHNWYPENTCYLQDLYADETKRGLGIGRALIEAVYERADQDGAKSVYWLTQDFNHQARKLYDKVATLTPFIKYQR